MAGLLILGVCVVIAAVAVWAAMPEKSAPPPSSLGTAQQPAAPLAPAAVPPEDVPPPPVPEMPEEPAPAIPEGGWPALAFTPEEVEALDRFFAEWAASEPAPAVPEAAQSETSSGSGLSAGQEEPAPHGKRVSVYFKDLDSGAEYLFTPDEKYPIASLSKAPYAQYLYQLADAGLCSLDETFTVDKADVEESKENSGKLKEETDLPLTLTMEELIAYMLRYSDTLAQRKLLQRYPAAEYAAWAATLGLAYPEDVRGVTSGNITARDAGVYLHALWYYMATGPNGEQLQQHLLNTSYPMIRSDYPVARKYGWDSGAYHDMAVVYAPHPYVLAVLTDKSAGDWNDHAMFAKTAAFFEELMAGKWAEIAS